MVKTFNHSTVTASRNQPRRRPADSDNRHQARRVPRAADQEEEKEHGHGPRSVAQRRPSPPPTLSMGYNPEETQPSSPLPVMGGQSQQQARAQQRSRGILSSFEARRAGGGRPAHAPSSTPFFRIYGTDADFRKMDNAKARQQRYVEELKREIGELRHALRSTLFTPPSRIRFLNLARFEEMTTSLPPLAPAPLVLYNVRCKLSGAPPRIAGREEAGTEDATGAYESDFGDFDQ